jgi:geranylgeranyl pyrophosphate synthase
MAQILTKISTIDRNSLSIKKNKKNESLKEVLSEIDKIIIEPINDCIENNISKDYHDILKKAMRNKENYERAFFVKMGFELFNANSKSICNAMVSVELRYASLVVTDDIFDNNDIRMQSNSIRKEIGDNSAISIGAILKSLSSIALKKQIRESAIDVNILTELDEKAHLLVYEGQLMDLSTEKMNIEDLNEHFYLDLIKKTTGDDVGYCFELGGRLAGCTDEEAINLKNAGTALGTAMQVRDDLLDYVNDNDLINKKSFRDFSGRKLRLPIYLGYKFSNTEEKIRIKELYKLGLKNEDDTQFISSVVFREEVLIYLENLLKTLNESASNSFHKIDTNQKNIVDYFDTIVNDIMKI